MFIQNHRPRNITLCMDIHLMPGLNDIPDKKWKSYRDDKRWERSFKGRLERGDISLVDEEITRESPEKVTIKMVNETFDSRILEDWLATAKGPLKGAIRKQIEKMKEDI